MHKLSEIYGWIGVLLILAAYFLTSFGYLSPSQLVYQLMNLFGAVGIIVSSLEERDMQPIVLNIVWGLVALFSIVSVLLNS